MNSSSAAVRMPSFMRLARACALLLLACGAGCSREERAPIPPPPAADANTVALALGAQQASGGLIARDVNFSGTNPPARASWDFTVSCDLRLRSGVQFDFFCDDLEQFSSFSCYFRSGDGWYHGTFAPEENGAWQRVTVLKSACSLEGKPQGWGNITALRISGWRAGTGRTRVALANVAEAGGRPDVAVVYADSLAATRGAAEAKSCLTFAGTLAASLRAIGVEPVVMADTDLSEAALAHVAAVALPYNPSLATNALAGLRAAVAQGKRVFACYAQPREVLDLLGVRLVGGGRRPGDEGLAPIAGFLRTGAGLAGQPAFSPQASWMTQTPARTNGVEVLAEWADGHRASLGIPALVRTRAGLYMSHVWLGGVDGEPAALMRAIVRDLAPSLVGKVAVHEADARRRADEMRAWLANQPSRPGEHRAFWCHSARGMGGDRDWDGTVRFLRDNGFNALIANLCWGGVAFYDSKVLPVANDVARRGDAFAQCRAACRTYGVKMHVWKVCWNMGGSTGKAFERQMVAAGRTQVDAKGKALTRWLCPSHPENQQLEIDAMLELAHKGADGVHFDYIRYPGETSCFCDGCRARFAATLTAEQTGALTNWPGAVYGAGAPLKREWTAFRAGNISRVVQEVSRRVRAETPGVQVSAALFGNPARDPETIAQDWPRWCREGWLDFACNMDYVESAALFRSQVRAQLAAAGKTPLYPGIGLSCWENDGRDAVRLAKQIAAARSLGLGGFTVFNLDRRAERALPLLRLGPTRED